MIFTLHRYIFRDLIKTFVITTLILSVLLGLGMMLRPLREFSVDPARVPELVLCTMPITLTMVMPIAALLAATLNYGRLAALNEINACRSSGIGLMTLMYPAFTLALLVGTVTLLLVFHVIPSYTERIEGILRADAESIIYRNIERSGKLGNMFPGIMIHADATDPKNHRLIGVAAVRMTPTRIEEIITARQVVVNISGRQNQNEVVLRFQNATVVSENGNLFFEETQIGHPIPSFWRDNIKFKKLSDLDRIREDMTLFEPVREMFDDYRGQLTLERYFEWVNRQLMTTGEVELQQGSNTLTINAERCELRSASRRGGIGSDGSQPGRLTGSGDWPISVISRSETGRERIYEARNGRLIMNVDRQVPQAALTLEEVRWHYVDDPYMQYIDRYPLGEVDVPSNVTSAVEALTLPEVLDGSAGMSLVEPSVQLEVMHSDLVEECSLVATKIRMERHFRLAFGVSCVVLVALGGALGIIFRSGHLLTAFGVSFLPAILCFVTISTGKHIAEQSNSGPLAGILFLWSGTLVVGIANAVVYRVLTRK
ncbi:MAG: LptF/LptG family permease [Sedimentisphaerales bacterium]|nr:LptF/LptG family permease [Sedimentisphaerales bacterium]